MAGYLCMSTAPPVYHVTSHLFYLWNTIFLIHVIFFLFFFFKFFFLYWWAIYLPQSVFDLSGSIYIYMVLPNLNIHIKSGRWT